MDTIGRFFRFFNDILFVKEEENVVVVNLHSMVSQPWMTKILECLEES